MPRILTWLRSHGLLLVQKIVHRMRLVLVLVLSKAAIVPHRHSSNFELVLSIIFVSFLSCYLGYGGSDDEVTECYVEEVEETIPLTDSPPVATDGSRTRTQSPAMKVSSSRHRSLDPSSMEEQWTVVKESDNTSRRTSRRARQREHEFEMNREKTPQVSHSLLLKLCSEVSSRFRFNCYFMRYVISQMLKLRMRYSK